MTVLNNAPLLKLFNYYTESILEVSIVCDTVPNEILAEFLHNIVRWKYRMWYIELEWMPCIHSSDGTCACSIAGGH